MSPSSSPSCETSIPAPPPPLPPLGGAPMPPAGPWPPSAAEVLLDDVIVAVSLSVPHATADHPLVLHLGQVVAEAFAVLVVVMVVAHDPTVRRRAVRPLWTVRGW